MKYDVKMLALIAPGQGAQTPGMLLPWIADPSKAELVRQWSEAIDLDLLHLGTTADADEIRDTAHAQPLIVAAGLLSAHALDLEGKFSFVAGHSVGEITAAALAGVMTEIDALRLVRVRGLEMAKAAAASPSGMSAVLGGDREVVLAAIAKAGLVAANDNGGGQIVAAGDLGALANLAPEGARVRALQVAGAFHTHFMTPAVEAFSDFASTITTSDPVVGVLSNRDGQVLSSGSEIIERIVSQVANPVRWDLCMSTMQSSGVARALEVAPAGTLVGLLKRAAEGIAGFAFKSPDDLVAANQFVSSKE
jgi:[acyl-carrier-protein] S-malonyltransferase